MANLFIRDELHGVLAELQRKAMASTESVPFTAGLAAFFFKAMTSTAEHLAKNAQALHDTQEATIAALVKRIDELEQTRTMSFEGPHDPSKSYRAGATVQRGSASGFHSLRQTSSQGRAPHGVALHGITNELASTTRNDA